MARKWENPPSNRLRHQARRFEGGNPYNYTVWTTVILANIQ